MRVRRLRRLRRRGQPVTHRVVRTHKFRSAPQHDPLNRIFIDCVGRIHQVIVYVLVVTQSEMFFFFIYPCLGPKYDLSQSNSIYIFQKWNEKNRYAAMNRSDSIYKINLCAVINIRSYEIPRIINASRHSNNSFGWFVHSRALEQSRSRWILYVKHDMWTCLCMPAGLCTFFSTKKKKKIAPPDICAVSASLNLHKNALWKACTRARLS